MTRSYRHLLLASTAASMFAYSGLANAQVATILTPGAVPTNTLSQLEVINSQVRTDSVTTGSFTPASVSSVGTDPTAAVSSSLNSLQSIATAISANNGITLSSVTTPVAPNLGAGAILSVQTATGEDVTAGATKGSITVKNGDTSTILAALTSSRDSISALATVNAAVNSIEGAVPLSLSGGGAANSVTLSTAAVNTVTSGLSILSAQNTVDAVGGAVLRAEADQNTISVTAAGSLDATSALLSQGSITAGFAGNDATNTLIANAGDGLTVTGAIGNTQVLTRAAVDNYGATNSKSTMSVNIGTTGLVASVAAVDGGTVSASSSLNTASNILGTAGGATMNANGTTLSVGALAAGSIGATTADYVVGNAQTATKSSVSADTSDTDINVTMSGTGEVDADSIARVASNTVSSTARGNVAANTAALTTNSSIAPTIAVVSAQDMGSLGDPTVALAGVSNTQFRVTPATIVNDGLMQVTGNSIQAMAGANEATNFASLTGAGATSGGAVTVSGRQSVADVTADASYNGTTFVAALANGTDSDGRFEVTNNSAAVEAVQNRQTNVLSSSGVAGAALLDVINVQVAASTAVGGGGAIALFVQGTGSFAAATSAGAGVGATLLVANNSISAAATNNRATNQIVLSALNPVTGNAAITSSQTATNETASAIVTGNAAAATMLASSTSTGAGNTVTSFGNRITATATGNAATSTIGTGSFSRFR